MHVSRTICGLVLGIGVLGIAWQANKEGIHRQHQCRALVNNIGPGLLPETQPAPFKGLWRALECGKFWPASAAGYPTKRTSSSLTDDGAQGGFVGWERWSQENTSPAATQGSGPHQSKWERRVCEAKPCVDSWSPGVWAHHCPNGKPCSFNFVPNDQDCMYQIFSAKSTAACMKDKWLLLLG